MRNTKLSLPLTVNGQHSIWSRFLGILARSCSMQRFCLRGRTYSCCDAASRDCNFECFIDCVLEQPTDSDLEQFTHCAFAVLGQELGMRQHIEYEVDLNTRPEPSRTRNCWWFSYEARLEGL